MTILCYHTVDDDWVSTLAVTSQAFDHHCRWLRRNRDVRPLGEVVDTLDRRYRPRGRVSALTFDDGWTGVHANAWPIARSHGLAMTVFVVVDTLFTADPIVDWVDGGGTQAPSVVTADEVREMAEAGVDIGSHSARHAVLTELGDAECTRDLQESREQLSELLGRPVTTLAYPRGVHDSRVRRAAERAGYQAAFDLPTTRVSVGRFAIPRVGIYPGNGGRALRIKTARLYLDARLSTANRLLRGDR